MLERSSETWIREQGGQRAFLIDNPLRLGEKIKVKDICPSCHSIHITAKGCESCGLQFGVDIIGEPFGIRSFFTLREDFEFELSLREKLLRSFIPWLFFRTLAAKKYIRHLKKRYGDLLGYFSLHSKEDISLNGNDSIELFLFEAKQIIHEMNSYHFDLYSLYKPLSQKEYISSFLFQELKREIDNILLYGRGGAGHIEEEGSLLALLKKGTLRRAFFIFLFIIFSALLGMKLILL